MAIVSAWTYVGNTDDIPSGSTIPTVAAPTGTPVIRADFEFEVAGSLDNATKTTAFTAIGDAVKTAWDSTYDTAKLGLDAAANIHVRLNITSITRGYSEFETTDKPNSFGVGTDVFKVVGYSEHAVDPA